MNQVKSSSH